MQATGVAPDDIRVNRPDVPGTHLGRAPIHDRRTTTFRGPL